MLKINVKTANRANYGNARNTNIIQYIVIHYTANDGDTAAGNASYFQRNIVNASAHYFVDDNGVYQSVPDNFIAWSVGGDKYPSADRTGGGKWWGKCKNSSSISVELCDTKRDGKSGFTEATMANAAELVRSLMKKYNVPAENVIRHFDVVGKICPKPFVDDPAAWEKFKERLSDEMVEKIKVIANGKECEVDGIRKDGTTYIKTRDIAAALGLKVGNKGSIPTLDK